MKNKIVFSGFALCGAAISMTFINLLFLSFLMASNVFALEFQIERRQEQFENKFGYLAVPAVYNLPGIGGGFMLIGYVGNMFETSADIQAIAFTGDAEGTYIALEEFFIIPDYVYLATNYLNISKFSLLTYSSREMDSEKDDHNIQVGSLYNQSTSYFTLTLFERRFQAALIYDDNSGLIDEIRDNEGELILEFDKPQKFSGYSLGAYVQVDYTDDYYDPRVGGRFKTTLTNQIGSRESQPNYQVISYNLTAYIPILDKSTWAFNVFKSDAFLSKEGETDFDVLLDEEGFNRCSTAVNQSECEKVSTENAQNTLNANKNGSADSLGGDGRLRSFSFQRFQAAHTIFYGTEFRWNLDVIEKDFDLVFISDFLRAAQIAFFYETGSVSETGEDLGSIFRSSYGIGARMVTGSGGVYRADVSTGEEGIAFTVIFNYPWS